MVGVDLEESIAAGRHVHASVILAHSESLDGQQRLGVRRGVEELQRSVRQVNCLPSQRSYLRQAAMADSGRELNLYCYDQHMKF